MLISLFKMILAHLIGDFVLQPKSWVARRKTNVLYLGYHLAVHTVLLLLFFIHDLSGQWENILFLIASHLAIDSLKIGIESRWTINPILLFTADQLLHFASIFAVYFYTDQPYFFEFISNFPVEKFLIFVIALVLAIFVVPIIIRVFFSKWNNEAEFNIKRKESLFDAGTLIGILERLFIIGFIGIDLYEGIGFLLAAKSIFRFGDLSNAKDTKFTEYVLIGTLLSFGFGTLIGLSLKNILLYL
ncbi:DUF3307 domain-containing protein [Sphingobacterium sp. HJSM2_6]